MDFNTGINALRQLARLAGRNAANNKDDGLRSPWQDEMDQTSQNLQSPWHEEFQREQQDFPSPFPGQEAPPIQDVSMPMPNSVSPMANQPLPDLEMGGISPYSLDARANVVLPNSPPIAPSPAPMQQEAIAQDDPNYAPTWLGRYLNKNLINPFMEETNTIINSIPSKQDIGRGVRTTLGKLATLAPPPVSQMGMPNPFEGGNNPLQSLQSSQSAPMASEIPQDSPMTVPMQQESPFPETAPYEPYGEESVPMAQAFQDPQVRQFTESIIGQEMTPEMMQQIEESQQVIKDIDAGLMDTEGQYSEQMAGLRQRIESNSATDMDKYLIGAAIMMPGIIAAAFGKEAGIGALGGSLTGLGKGMAQRGENVRKDTETLANITAEKGKLGVKRGELKLKSMEIPAEIKKNMKGSEHLEGKKMLEWKDPKNGKQEKGIEVSPGLVAPVNMLNSKEAAASVDKAAAEISERIGDVDAFASGANDVFDLAAAIEKSNPSMWQQMLGLALGGKEKGRRVLSAMAGDIEVNGKMVNPVAAMNNLIGILQDTYMKGQRIRRTEGGAHHASEVEPNLFEGAVKAKDVMDITRSTMETLQNNAVKAAKAKGFYEYPLKLHFDEEKKQSSKVLNKAAQRREEENIVKSL